MNFIDKLIYKSKGWGGKRYEHELTLQERTIYNDMKWVEKLCRHEWLKGASGEMARRCTLLKGHNGAHEY